MDFQILYSQDIHIRMRSQVLLCLIQRRPMLCHRLDNLQDQLRPCRINHLHHRTKTEAEQSKQDARLSLYVSSATRIVIATLMIIEICICYISGFACFVVLIALRLF